MGGTATVWLLLSVMFFANLAFDPRTKIMSVLADDIGPELHKLWPTLIALRHDNPAITYHLSHAVAPAFTMGDLLPPAQWKKTAVFNEFYSKLGMQELRKCFHP
jgi:hypothetical protein